MVSKDSSGGYAKIPLEARIRKNGAMIVVQGVAKELEPEGMTLRLIEEVEADSNIAITLRAPEFAPINLACKVLWSEKISDRITECGVIISDPPVNYYNLIQVIEQKLDERRQQKRYDKVVQVSFESKEAFLREITTNISSGGMYIKTNQPLDEMTEFDLELIIPGLKEPIRVRANVVFVLRQNQVSASTPPAGMGVEFKRFKQGDDLRFYLFMDRLKKAYGK